MVLFLAIFHQTRICSWEFVNHYSKSICSFFFRNWINVASKFSKLNTPKFDLNLSAISEAERNSESPIFRATRKRIRRLLSFCILEVITGFVAQVWVNINPGLSRNSSRNSSRNFIFKKKTIILLKKNRYAVRTCCMPSETLFRSKCMDL